jgi:uncharacterized membrane protein
MRWQSLLVVLILLAIGRAADGVTLRWVGPSGLDPLIQATAVDMSADGKSILGNGLEIIDDRNAVEFLFIWKDGFGNHYLDRPEGSTHVQAISADGTVVIGGHEDQAAYWDNSGFHLLGLDALRSSAQDVSEAGRVIIGTSTSGPYMWTQAGGMELLPAELTPHEISADGTIIVGDIVPSASTTGHLSAAFWSKETGIVQIERLPGAERGNSALGISPDGSKIFGTSSTPDGFQPYLWSAATGVTSMSAAVDEFFPYDVSDTGVVVGRARFEGIVHAAIWTEGGGLERVVDYLRNQGLDLAPDARLGGFAKAISADGTVLTGYGGNPVLGAPTIWIADLAAPTIPEPSTLVLLAAGVLSLTLFVQSSSRR